MKKLYIYLLCALFALISNELHAIKAYPEVITVTQPNGTALSIRVYGDEFLNYTTTTSGQLIKAGEDGYYYYASFRGANIEASSQRVSSGSSVLTRGGGSVVVPMEALVKAQKRRDEWARNMMDKKSGLRAPRTRAANNETYALVLLVQFNDVKFQNGAQTEFTNMMTQRGYSTDGATGSVRDYYIDNTMGEYNINFVTAPIVTLSNAMTYYSAKNADSYGNADGYSKVEEMIIEACKEAKKLGVNFSQFDNDNDGVVDQVYLFYAGYDAAYGAKNAIWAHSSMVFSSELFDGKQIKSYACSSELMGVSGTKRVGIGTATHEFGHILGMMDLYDTNDNVNGTSQGLSQLALMNSGNYNNSMKTPPYLTSIEREMLGIIKPTEILNIGQYTAESIDKNKAYIIQSGNANEYFLIEHRNNEKWDKYIGGAGMLIYHVDKSENSISNGITAFKTWDLNQINAYADHQCAKVVHPTNELEYSDVSQLFYPGINSVKAKKLTSWSSREIPQSLTNIVNNGSTTTFQIEMPTIANLRGIVTNLQKQPIPGAKLFIKKKEQTNVDTRTLSNGSQIISLFDEMSKVSSNQLISDSKGQFLLNDIEQGTYSYLITCDNYSNMSGEIEVVIGDNVWEVVLMTSVEKNTKHLSWAQDVMHYALGFTNSDFYGANSWEPTDLIDYQGGKISSISFVSNNNTLDATVGVVIDNKIAYTKALGVNYNIGANQIDISSAGIIIPPNKSVMIWVKYENETNQSIKSLGLDKGPVVAGKGNLISVDGKNWVSLDEQNVIIGMTVVTDDNENKVKKIVMQRSALLDFTTVNPASKEARIELSKIGDEGVLTVLCGAVQQYMVTGLMPETIYNFKILVDGETVAIGSFVTEAIKSEYALIYESKKSYEVDDKLILDVLNLKDGVQSVKWFVNGKEHPAGLFTLTEDTELRVEITYSEGDVEVISRKISIKK